MEAARSTADVFQVACETDRFWCAREVRRFARGLGFGERAQWELAIVVAELVTNAVRYGGGSGTLTLRTAGGRRAGMEMVVADPGRAAAVDGSALVATPPRHGLGLGLGTVRILSHEVSIERHPDGGTVVTAARYLEP